MTRALHWVGAAIVVLLAAWIAWQIVTTRVADSLAGQAPRRALRWDANNPQALHALAETEIESGHPRAAATTARHLLRVAPLQADAFAVLARAAAADGNQRKAQDLFAIALRRAPRNQYARAWAIGNDLQHKNYAAALHNVNVLLGVEPGQQSALLPLLANVASRDPGFATALAQALANRPAWRNDMLTELLAHAPAATVNTVFDSLQASPAGIDDTEANAWFDRLEKDGHWGQAYSRWASRTGAAAGGRIPAVYNGNYADPVTGTGFNWRMHGEPGVTIDRVRTTDPAGWAAQVTFRERRADDMGFWQPLLLAPGRYTLTFRARADNLQSDAGLEWSITCMADGTPIANSPLFAGTFNWRPLTVDFDVPASQCKAQRLQLTNPGAGGSGKIVSGKVWFTEFRIQPIR